MRVLLIVLLVLTYFFSFSQTLISWNFSGQPGNQTTQNSSSSGTGIGTGVLSRGSGLTATTAANTMISNDWFESNNDMDDVVEQISENDYYEWTLPINNGYKAVISSVNVTTAASGTGPTGWELRSSLDGYSSAYSPSSAELTGTVSFRLYGTRSASGGGTGGTGRITALSITGTSALPVTFYKLNVFNVNNINNISFSTASETNNDYFTIERSADGRSFDAIGEIDGAGNSSEERHYTFIDESPLPGINYYRIKQTDYDGKYSYSEIRSVVHDGGQRISVTPIQTEGIVHITTSLEDYSVSVYSSAGQEVSKFSGMSGYQTVDISTLQSGIYFVQVTGGSMRETVRLVKF